MSGTDLPVAALSAAPLPAAHLQWELTGAGLESLSLQERPVPQPGPGELLVRVDACGICFSDIKILNLGENHPRLQGRDLAAEPVVMGHETAMTVLQAGAELGDRFQAGQRFLIQADVYVNGVGTAFGYRLPGGYSQYQVIGKEILDGDEGCYLLPVAHGISHAQAAMCEPWACVEAAYACKPRKKPLAGGRSLVVLMEFDEIREIQDEVSQLTQPVTLSANRQPWLRDGDQAEAGVQALQAEHPDGFDDILIYGQITPRVAEQLAKLLRSGGVFALQHGGDVGLTSVDIGSVHYRDHWYTGASHGDIYAWDRTAELKAGGIAWFIGAGGPLGQMHLQRALALPDPPAQIIVTQNGGSRFDELRQRFGPLAASRGIRFSLLDTSSLGAKVYEAVQRETRGHGCDDIVVVIPNAPVVEHAYELLAPGGGMNVFAGVAVGTNARIDLGRVAADGVRLWGTSGSKVSDLRAIVEKVESGSLQTDMVVAAVGGVEAVKAGLEAVRDGVFPGKTVIYPHVRNLPLTTVPDLADRHPSIKERLLDGHYWTPEAEAELLRLYGA